MDRREAVKDYHEQGAQVQRVTTSAVTKREPTEQTDMAEIKVKNGQAYCKKCGRNVAVREEKGDASREQKPLILVDDQGHIIAERYTTAGAWNRAA
jgi:hypothetical protein